jgi:uncharacterized repeat protein (TIGR02543 family)
MGRKKMKTGKRILCTILALCMALSLAPCASLAAAANMPFTDVKSGDWFHDGVQYVYDNSIVNGTSPDKFSPYALLDRGMLVTMLWRMDGKPTGTGSVFRDVPAGKWYSDAIAWASGAKIVSGYGNGLFGTKDPVTREQIALILYNYAVSKGYDVSAASDLSSFADVGNVHSWALAAMKWAVASGLIGGKGGGRLDPNGKATRAEAVSILQRFSELAAKSIDSGKTPGAETPAETGKPTTDTGSQTGGTPYVAPVIVSPRPTTSVEPTDNFTVSFDLNYSGAAAIASQTVASGQTATKPEDPSRDGYRFVAWYGDSGLTTPYDFDSPVTAEITIYAKWESILIQTGFIDQPVSEVEIYSLYTDTWDILAGTAVNVTFTSEIFSESVLNLEDVSVVDNTGSVIGYMHDDGLDGDKLAGDGEYTLQTQLFSNTVCTKQYYVHVKDVESPKITIGFYKEFSSEELKEPDAIGESINQQIGSYVDENGNFSEENYSTIIEIIDSWLKSSDAVDSYHFESDGYSVTVNLKSGVSFVYCLNHNGYYSGSSKINIATYQPCKKEEVNYPQGEDEKRLTDGSAESFANTYKNYIFSGNFDDKQVTFDLLKHLSDYGLVIWNGHGKFFDEYGSSLCIPKVAATSTYSADISDHRIILTEGIGVLYDHITGGFFQKYVRNLNNTRIFLFACSTCKDQVVTNKPEYSLVESLINNGASEVLGIAADVRCSYCLAMGSKIFEYMMTVKTTSGLFGQNKIYYTAAEALKKANEFMSSPNSGYYNYHNTTDAKFYLYTKSNISAVYDSDAEFGTIVGSVKSAAANTAISNALVRVYYNDGNFVTSTRTDAAGSYSLSLPANDYVIQISAGTYKSAKMAVTINENQTTYAEIFLLISAGSTDFGYANGRITNSITGTSVADVQINVRLFYNNRTGKVIYTTSSNSNGFYEMNIIPGFYTLECYKSGYITTYKNITVSGPLNQVEQNVVISPITSEGTYRVVLSWGENPLDIDSHLNASGTHIYYQNLSSTYANLDIDDRTSYGPETITVTDLAALGGFTYSVHNYTDKEAVSGDAAALNLANSGAVVKLYKGSSLLQTFNIPTNRAGTVWNVFSISSTGSISSINTFAYQSDPTLVRS